MKGVDFMTCKVYVTKEENWYVATDIATGVASQGTTMDSALANLKEALELYFEDSDNTVETVPTFFTTLEVFA